MKYKTIDLEQSGKNLIKLRKKSGYTQTEFAKRIGVNLPRYSELENGKRNFTKYYLEKISSFYNISISEIIVYHLNEKAFEKTDKEGRNLYLIGNLKRLRNFCELSQQEMADILGINRSSYAYYENGKVEPSVAMLSRIISIYKEHYDLDLCYDDLLSRVWSFNPAKGEIKK